MLAAFLGFGAADTGAIVLAVSELATNLLRYAKNGEIVLVPLERVDSVGIQIESRDVGPGIADVNRAMEDGFSTGQGLGGGLPGVRRLMDEFTITSGSTGTTIQARKWHPKP